MSLTNLLLQAGGNEWIPEGKSIVDKIAHNFVDLPVATSFTFFVGCMAMMAASLFFFLLLTPFLVFFSFLIFSSCPVLLPLCVLVVLFLFVLAFAGLSLALPIIPTTFALAFLATAFIKVFLGRR